MAAILALGALFFLVFFAIVVVFYILGAVGLFKMAQNLGIENPWLAFIPVANLYIIGKIAGGVKFQDYEIPNIELILPIGSILVLAMSRVSVIGPILSIAFFVLYLITIYNIYKKYRGEKATLMIILSIILSFMPAIYFFGMRDERPMM